MRKLPIVGQRRRQVPQSLYGAHAMSCLRIREGSFRPQHPAPQSARGPTPRLEPTQGCSPRDTTPQRIHEIGHDQARCLGLAGYRSGQASSSDTPSARPAPAVRQVPVHNDAARSSPRHTAIHRCAARPAFSSISLPSPAVAEHHGRRCHNDLPNTCAGARAQHSFRAYHCRVMQHRRTDAAI